MIEALTNLDKSTWVKHRFDEIAMMVSERVDPNKTDLEIYVGLEHLDSESLHIRSHGTADDVNGTKLRFYKGDVIFGRRRAYQRKAAIAEYDGFCSAHALVLRAKPEIIDPALFPFFLHSDQFMHRAVDISVGSLSPTINWKSLRKQEFLLPPKAEQARLAELLWAGDGVLEGLERVVLKSDSLFDSWLNKSINGNQGWPRKRLEEIATVQTGMAKNKKIKEEENTVEVPYLRVANVQDGYLDLKEVKFITARQKDLIRYGLQAGDLLMTEGGDIDKLGRGHIWEEEVSGCIHQNHVFAVRSDTRKVKPRYLALVARSLYGKQYFLSRAKRTSNLASINSTQIKKFPVPLPELQIQMGMVEKSKSIYSNIAEVKKHISSSHALQKSLINQIF